MNFLLFILIAGAFFLVLYMLKSQYVRELFRWRARRKLIDVPFLKEWEEIIKKNVALYNRMPEDLQSKLKYYVQIFLHEKSFVGCNGLTVTDEMRVTVAALAVILILNQKRPTFFPKLYTVALYPNAYFAEDRNPDGTVKKSLRLGESWLNGKLVLAWQHVREGEYKFRDGHNLVMHEFAHQLDQEDGKSDGVPTLSDVSAYSPWYGIFSNEYKVLLKKVKKKHNSLLDEYGSTNPAEFFAVATETFFEKSHQMKLKHPQLYQTLVDFYKLDPSEWIAEK